MITEASPSIETDRLWEEPWPKEGLEALGKCPVCGDTNRHILHPDLVDNTFFCAVGKWTLWSCNKCQVAYLDPRPTPETIGDAYLEYYTHAISQKKLEYEKLDNIRKIRRRLANGYINWKFGAKSKPSSSLGILAAYLAPKMRGALETEYRNLPKITQEKLKVLDYGCGGGSFLKLAEDCGWEAVGVDPDKIAVANARAEGLNVQLGGIEVYDGMTSIFDVITIKHVIEHLHDPVSVLRSCCRLLKPGGKIWLETPNIDSYGHQIFGRNWRGIEAPRHLTIFNFQAMSKALTEAKFERIEVSVHRDVYLPIFEVSAAIASGKKMDQKLAFSLPLKTKASLARIAGTFITSKREFLSITATKARS